MALITSAKYFGFFLIYLKCSQFIHAECLSVGDVPQCHCYDFENFACSRLHSFSQLFLIASKLYGYELHVLDIRNSKLRFWPSSIFRNIVIDEIYLIECEILTFEEEDFSQGLEGTFKVLDATKTNLIENGEWKLNIRSLKTLTKLRIQNIDIPELTQSISYGLPEGLKNLRFVDCEIRELEGRFFSPLRNLEHLNLEFNRITNLPKELNILHLLKTLELSGNNILKPPENMMISFPNLRSLELAKNGISILPKHEWEGIFAEVSEISLQGNPLKCDTNMKWILEVKKVKLYGMKCAEPEGLAGKDFRDLTSEDFEQQAARD